MHVHVVEGYCLVAVGNDVCGVDQVEVGIGLVGMVLSLVRLVADLTRLIVDLFGLEVDWVRIVMGLVGLDHSLRGPLLTAERFTGERGRDGGHDRHDQEYEERYHGHPRGPTMSLQKDVRPKGRIKQINE